MKGDDLHRAEGGRDGEQVEAGGGEPEEDVEDQRDGFRQDDAREDVRSTDRVERFVDQIDPHSMRSGHHLRAIAVAHQRWQDAEAELRAAVRQAREAGDSWRIIAVTLNAQEHEVRRQFEN